MAERALLDHPDRRHRRDPVRHLPGARRPGAGPGTQAMEDVAGTILEGAVAFIRRQYTTIAILAVVASVIIGVVIALVETPEVADVPSPRGRFADRRHDRRSRSSSARPARWLSGIIGMFVAVKSNVRTASAARRSLVEAVQVAMRGGAVSGFLVVALSLLGVWGIFIAYDSSCSAARPPPRRPFLIVGFGFGACFVALFAQLGGGIYTKAADVGSDLVGKVEKGIPEDDPRNAGVIADLVGDNVGDCAGRGADLFESTAAENIGAMILGVAVFKIATRAGWPNPEAWIFFPLVVRAFGLLATIVAIFFVRGKETEDPMSMLNRGYWVTTLLSVVGLAFVTSIDDADQRRPAPTACRSGSGSSSRRRRRPGDERRVRLHHAVLHGGLLPTGARDRRGVQDRARRPTSSAAPPSASRPPPSRRSRSASR